VISPDYFLRHHEGFDEQFKVLEKFTAKGSKTCAARVLATLPTRNDAGEAEQQQNNGRDEVLGVGDSSEGDGESAPLAQATTKKHAGFIIEDVQLRDGLQKKFEMHAHKCRGYLEKTASTKFGFTVLEVYSCKTCNEQFQFQTSHSVNLHRKGRKSTELNVSLNESLFESGVTVQKGLDCLAKAGIQSPSENGMRKARDRVEDVANNSAQEQICQNRLEHVKACRAQSDYKGDLVFTDGLGKKHSIARGPVMGDGGGTKRSYDHRHTGEEHMTNQYSGLTGKCIATQHDQCSCKRCSLKFTEEFAKSDKSKACNLTRGTFDLSHSGVCHRNTVHGPATAEEYAFEDIAVSYLLDPKTRELLPDDEAIFVDQMVTDGDSRGAKRLIQKQVDVLLEHGFDATGLAKQVPDIGHFVKTVSNAFYKLANEDSTIKGAGLLEPTRIRALSSDVSKHLRRYHEKRKKQPMDVAKLRAECLSSLKAIVPHHAGNHNCCSSEWCKFQQIKDKMISDRRESGDATPVSEKAVQKEYAKVARFGGKLLSVGEAGQKRLSKVITSRVMEKNINRLAFILSSNLSENFFGMLIKYSEGKRLYFGQSDSTEVFMNWVAGMQANPHLGDQVLEKLGAPLTEIRVQQIQKKEKKQELDRKRKRTEQYNNRRIAHKQIQLHQLGKDLVSRDRHKRDKLPPTEDCRGSAKKVACKKKATRAMHPKKSSALRKCSNCGSTVHIKSQCPEPGRGKVKDSQSTTNNSTTKKQMDEIAALFGCS